MSTLFISDLHLEEGLPHITGWLMDFLAGPARSAEAVYILGDLFELWIGDDALSITAQRLAEVTAELHSNGVGCFFMHGNRDFLLGEDYARQAGMTLLPESTVIDLYGTPTLLLHGDSLCTDDVEYQAFRQQSRSAAWQAGVLALSVAERLQMARNARDASKQHTGNSAMEIMDVNESAVCNAFAEHRVSRIIHGHTHRPAIHQHRLADGKQGERFVLADWGSQGSYLKADSDRLESISLASDKPSN
jgi:UDP-2,3-diacylglucosamine hydrolase